MASGVKKFPWIGTPGLLDAGVRTTPGNGNRPEPLLFASEGNGNMDECGGTAVLRSVHEAYPERGVPASAARLFTPPLLSMGRWVLAVAYVEGKGVGAGVGT